MLAAGQHQAADRHHVHAADGFTDRVALIDIGLRYEFIDLDGAGGLKRNVVELLLVNLDVGVGIDLEALRDVLVEDFFARIGIHLEVFNAVTGRVVDLVEADHFGIGGGRKKRYRTGNQGKAQKALPVGRGAMGKTPTQRTQQNLN
jgi:hypothetical protein